MNGSVSAILGQRNCSGRGHGDADTAAGSAALALESSARLRPRLAGGDVYTDDRAPVEWLIDGSLLEYAGG